MPIQIHINSNSQIKGYLHDADKKNHTTKEIPKMQLSKMILHLIYSELPKMYPKVKPKLEFQWETNILKLLFITCQPWAYSIGYLAGDKVLQSTLKCATPNFLSMLTS